MAPEQKGGEDLDGRRGSGGWEKRFRGGVQEIICIENRPRTTLPAHDPATTQSKSLAKI